MELASSLQVSERRGGEVFLIFVVVGLLLEAPEQKNVLLSNPLEKKILLFLMDIDASDHIPANEDGEYNEEEAQGPNTCR